MCIALALLMALANGTPADGKPPRKPVLEPRGFLVANVAVNSGTVAPGSYAFFLIPPARSRRQFFVSAAQTVLGFKLSRISLGVFEVTGALDVSLRSPTPLIQANVLSPFFYDVHTAATTELTRISLGWFPDLLLATLPGSLNLFPVTYLPGSLGFSRPQARLDRRIPVRRRYQVIAQAAAGTPIQTFEISDELLGRQAGLPDGLARVAFAVGSAERKWNRPFELGMAGHLGRRRVEDRATGEGQEFTTWSLGVDLRWELPFGATVSARAWRGALLGDFTAGAFQTVSPSLRAIDAAGGYVTCRQALGSRWKVGAGYGRDDRRNDDLDPGGRTVNEAAFVNVSWDITEIVGCGFELARWRTGFRAAPDATVWRTDLPCFLRF